MTETGKFWEWMNKCPSKYKYLKELVFYRIENQTVKVKIAIPKYKSYVLKILNLK